MSKFLDAIDKVHCRFDKEHKLIPTTIRWLDMNHDVLQADVTMDRYHCPLSHSTDYTISTKFSMRMSITDEILDKTQVDMEELVFNKFKAMIQEKLYAGIQMKLEETYARISHLCTNVIEAEMVDQLFDALRKEIER
jgi:hypothetical protein